MQDHVPQIGYLNNLSLSQIGLKKQPGFPPIIQIISGQPLSCGLHEGWSTGKMGGGEGGAGFISNSSAYNMGATLSEAQVFTLQINLHFSPAHSAESQSHLACQDREGCGCGPFPLTQYLEQSFAVAAEGCGGMEQELRSRGVTGQSRLKGHIVASVSCPCQRGICSLPLSLWIRGAGHPSHDRGRGLLPAFAPNQGWVKTGNSALRKGSNAPSQQAASFARRTMFRVCESSGLLKLQAEPPSSVLAAPRPQALWLQPLERVDESKASHLRRGSKAIGGGTRGEESESESSRRIPKGGGECLPLSFAWCSMPRGNPASLCRSDLGISCKHKNGSVQSLS